MRQAIGVLATAAFLVAGFRFFTEPEAMARGHDGRAALMLVAYLVAVFCCAAE